MGSGQRLIALLVIFWLTVAIHECGHYTACVATESDVDEVIIGSGQTLVDIKLPFGGQLKLNLLPIGGRVSYLPSGDPHQWYIVGPAGMLATSSAAFLLFLLSLYRTNPDEGLRMALKIAFRCSFLAWLLFPFRLVKLIFTWNFKPIVDSFWGLRYLFGHPQMTYGGRQIGAWASLAFMCASWMALSSGMNLFPSEGSVDGAKLLALAVFSVFGKASIEPLAFLLNWLNWTLLFSLAFWILHEVALAVGRHFGWIAKEPKEGADGASGGE